MERTILNKRQQTQPFVRPITMGGTGATEPQPAIENLGGIHTSKIGAPEGITPLDINNLIPVTYFPSVAGVSEPNLDGPTTVYTSMGESGVSYQITNFDSTIEYTLTSNKGTVGFVSVNDRYDVVNFTPPNTPGIAVISINGKNFPIQVLIPYVDTPTIELPLDSANVIQTSIGFRSSDPSLIVHGFVNPTVDIHWQIATDVNFTNIISDEYIHDSTWEYRSPVSGPLFVRVRYEVFESQDMGYDVNTPWSNTISLNAIAATAPSTLLQVINDHVVNDEALQFKNGNISPDGTLLAIMRTDTTNNTSSWTIYQKAALPPHLYEVAFQPLLTSEWIIDSLTSIRFSADNQRFFLNCRLNRYEPNIGNSHTRVLVYKTTVDGVYTDWTLEQTLQLDLSDFGTGVLNASGTVFSLSGDTSTIAIGVNDMVVSGSSWETGQLTLYSRPNGVVIFKRDQSGIYQQIQTIMDPYIDPTLGNYSSEFGAALALNYDGSHLVVMAPNMHEFVNNTPIQTQHGAVNFYEFNMGVYSNVYDYTPKLATHGLTGLNYMVAMAQNAYVVVLAGRDIDDYQRVIVLENMGNNQWTETQFYPPGWNDPNSVLQGEVDSLVISDDGTFIALGSAYSSTAYSSAYQDSGSWDATGYVCYYNKINEVWTYSGILDVQTHEVIMGKFGYQLALTSDNTLAVFSQDYDRWATYYTNWSTSPYRGAVLIYK